MVRLQFTAHVVVFFDRAPSDHLRFVVGARRYWQALCRGSAQGATGSLTRWSTFLQKSVKDLDNHHHARRLPGVVSGWVVS